MKTFKVVLMIGTEKTVGRELLRGLANYANLVGSWQIYSPPPFYVAPANSRTLIRDLRNWQPDGIVLIEHERGEPVSDVLSLGVPTIASFVTRARDRRYPAIYCDEASIGRLAAEHLIERGFRRFAFCGYRGMWWSATRQQGFRETVEKGGHEFFSYEHAPRRTHHSWKEEHDNLTRWLENLPKPVGLLACNDDYARDIIATCRSCGLHVPDQVAVVGVDNDDLVCCLCSPPISSVNINFERAGYETGELLDELMRGAPMAGQEVLAQPTHVEIRASSDTMAVEDDEVSAAVRFIREHARRPIQVSDVVEAIPLSRRSLELRFRKVLGHSVNREIRRARMRQIATLLLQTNQPLSQIVMNLGFPGIKHVARSFREEIGYSPSAFRKAFGSK